MGALARRRLTHDQSQILADLSSTLDERGFPPPVVHLYECHSVSANRAKEINQ